MKKILIILILVISNLAAEKLYEVKSGVIEYKVVGDNKMGNIKLIFNDYGNKMRTMMKIKNINMEIYTIFNNGLAYTVNDNQKIFMKSTIEDMPFAIKENFETLKSIKIEKIIGKKCKVYSVDGNKFWLWKGIVLKVDSKDDGGDLVAISIQEVPTPVTAYEIPKDYKEMEISKGR